MGKSGNGGGGGGLFDSLNPSGQTLHIVQLGLDSAGKTTVLYRLKFDQYLNTVPTIGFNCEKIRGTGKAKGVQFLVWDVGGQEKLRPLWRSYTRCTDGIVFVLDSVDVERMEEAKIELMRTANSNVGVPVLVLANKQDLPGAKDPQEIEKLLGLNELIQQPLPLPGSAIPLPTSSSQQPVVAGGAGSHSKEPFKGWHIQPACAITGEGLQEGLDALYEMILKRRKILKVHKKRAAR